MRIRPSFGLFCEVTMGGEEGMNLAKNAKNEIGGSGVCIGQWKKVGALSLSRIRVKISITIRSKGTMLGKGCPFVGYFDSFYLQNA